MPSSRYYRFKTADEQEKKRRRKTRLFWIVFTIGLFTIIWSFFVSPFFKITEIQIPESNIVTKEDINRLIVDSLPLKIGKNILLLPSGHLKTALAVAFPAITNLKVNKKLFHTITIGFEKRVQIGFWCHPTGDELQADNCYSFDKDGIIFKEAPTSEGSLILKIKDFEKKSVSIGDKILDDNNLKFILSFNDTVEKTNHFKIIEFRVKPAPNIDLEAVVNDDWSIYLDPSQNPKIEASNLFTVVNEALKNKLNNLSYIDLRVPSRIFYKLK
ncbi:MAG: hypothetical protein Q7K16_03130 [Candidatus Azambacteria bacterium]|nr:hypothetical protein [Candidatus Azambacteria bacterium]